MQLQIQGREIALDGLQPGSMLPAQVDISSSREEAKIDLSVICIFVHSRKMAEIRVARNRLQQIRAECKTALEMNLGFGSQ